MKSLLSRAAIVKARLIEEQIVDALRSNVCSARLKRDNFDIRGDLLEYDDVVNVKREVVDVMKNESTWKRRRSKTESWRFVK